MVSDYFSPPPNPHRKEEVKHGIYIGADNFLFNEGALLRKDPENDLAVLAQFDDIHLLQAFGWHSFLKKDFKIDGEDDDQ